MTEQRLTITPQRTVTTTVRRVSLGLLFAVMAIVPFAHAQQASPLARVQALELDTAKVGRVSVYFASADRVHAEQLAALAEEAAAYFESEFGTSFPLHLAVLNQEDWFDGWTDGDDDPYGMPWGWVQDLLMVLPASLDEGILIHESDEEASLRNIRFIMLHEFGHLANKKILHPESDRPYSQIWWFEEFLATYFAYAFVRSAYPEWAKTIRSESLKVIESNAPAVLSLDWGFMRELPPEEFGQVYGWYQNLLNLRVAAVYAEHGLDFLRQVKAQLAWDEAGEWTTTETVIPTLEEFAPGFRAWVEDLEKGNYLLSADPVMGQPAVETETDPELQRLIRQLYVQGDFHGGILIAEGKEVIVQDAWGIADHEKGQVLTPEHRFNVNSMGKMFTAILIMRLVEEGRLELDDPLSRYLPQLDHPRSDDVSIHMLLSHRSGIPDYFINQLRGEIPMEADLPSILRTVARMELDFEPGTMFHYSNTGYLLLGMIIEREYGKSFAEVLEEQLFHPLGMEDTALDFDVFGDRVPKYYMQDGRVREGSDPFFVGDGGQTSSLQDMHRFMLALGSEQLLSEESWERMFTPHSLPSEALEGAWPPPHQVPYGYGFSLLQLPYSEGSTALAAGHGGAGLGSNYAVRYLNSGRIVIVWNNMSKPPLLPEVFEYLASQHSGDRGHD